MTARELIELAARDSRVLVAIFALLPLAAWFWGLLHSRDKARQAPWKYGWSVLVYLACVPGMIAAVLTAYTLFFVRANLLDVNLAVYGLPILSMILVLVIVRRRIAFDAIPGFDRLSGLLLTVALSFAIALAIQKMNIWVVFGGSVGMLLLLALAIFLAMSWAGRMLFGGRHEHRRVLPP
jgi:hypothetical protein